MKALLTSLLIASTSSFATTKIHQKTVRLPVTISENTVITSSAGYSETMVKIIVPALADVTLLNHRNPNAGGPCLSTLDAQIPEDVIQGTPSKEQIPFTITISKSTSLNQEKTKCQVTMSETAEATIRGKKFLHTVYHGMQERSVEDCR